MAEAALKRMGDQPWGDASAAREASAGQGVVYPFVSRDSAPEVGMAGRVAQWLSVVRRYQKKHFPGALGSDACWAVLLQLYAAHVYQHRIYIHTLTDRTGVPGTSVLRALETLTAAGFASRSEDRFDRRRVIVELTEAGASAMKECLLNSGSRAEFF